MRYAGKILGLLGIALLQGSVLHALFFPSIFAPNLAVVYALSRTFLRGFDESAVSVLAMGLLYDVLVSEVFGTATVSLIVLSYGMSVLKRHAMPSVPVFAGGVVFLYVVFAMAFFSLVSAAAAGSGAILEAAASVADYPVRNVWYAAISAGLFWVWRASMKRFTKV